MSDEREICMQKYDIKVVLCECDIRYASEICAGEKPIICLGNTLSIVITIAQSYVGKKLHKKFWTGLYLFAGSLNLG